MDVQFPLGRRPGGSKAFDLPPGRTERHWESSPAVPGTILGMGGHLHDHGVSLEVKDVTTGEILWHVEPVRSEEHTSELQSQSNLVCRLLLEKKKKTEE